jgi:hypothetical protein
MRTLITTVVASILSIGVASASTGRTTNKTYRSAQSAALHTGAFYLNKDADLRGYFGAVHAKNLKIELKAGKSASKSNSRFLVETKQMNEGSPVGEVRVSVRQLKNGKWVGQTGSTSPHISVNLPESDD